VAKEELVDEDLWQAMLLWLPSDRADVRGARREHQALCKPTLVEAAVSIIHN
jgi:hypothetical protein